jgi:chemotaxis protein CheZ
MKMNELPVTAHATRTSAEVHQQLGEMARQLHDTMKQLGLMPKLGELTDSLPDARSRLSYIAAKTGAAAERVLNLVDQAKFEQSYIAAETRRMGREALADAASPDAAVSMVAFVGDIEAATARVDQYLTNIMIAQDFHNLTGQVVAKVVKLAGDIEDQLIKLLVDTAPAEHVHWTDPSLLHGPVVNPEGRPDAVSSQEQVDDLLASLGF